MLYPAFPQRFLTYTCLPDAITVSQSGSTVLITVRLGIVGCYGYSYWNADIDRVDCRQESDGRSNNNSAYCWRHTERHIDRTRPSAIASIYSDMQRGFLHVISNATVTEAYYQIDGPDQKELTWNI